MLYYNQGYFSEALAEIQKCNELQENHPWLPVREFQIYWQIGEEEKAHESLWAILERDSIYNLEIAKDIYEDSGLQSLIQWKLKIDEAHDENSPYAIASTYGMIGEDEKALYWLEKAYTAHQTGEIYFNIHFRDLHNNPRYIEILKNMGLEE